MTHVHTLVAERMSAVSKQWKELSESEREKYNDEAHESYAAFVKEAEEYLKDLESDDERAMAREALLGKRRSTPAAKAAAKKKKSSKPKAPKKPTAQSVSHGLLWTAVDTASSFTWMTIARRCPRAIRNCPRASLPRN